MSIYLSVFGFDEISEALGLFIVVQSVTVSIVAVSMIMGMRIFRRANILHLQHITALRAALNRAVFRHLDLHE
jgi:hypothetical protein